MYRKHNFLSPLCLSSDTQTLSSAGLQLELIHIVATGGARAFHSLVCLAVNDFFASSPVADKNSGWVLVYSGGC